MTQGNQQSAADERATMRAPQIVVAEDDDDIRTLIAAALRHAGCDVVEARDGTELLKRMERSPTTGARSDADVILSDVRMPRLTGLQVLQRLRVAECISPAILMSAYRDADVDAEAARLGAGTILEKPFALHDVVDAVLGRLSVEAWTRWSRWTVYAETAFGLGGDGTPG